MDIVIIAVCCILVVELLLYTKLISTVRDVNFVYSKITNVIRSKSISDHWKEKALKKYAGIVFRLSFKIMLKLIIIFLPFIIAVLLFERTTIQVEKYLYTPFGIVCTTALAIGYGIVRKKYVKQ